MCLLGRVRSAESVYWVATEAQNVPIGSLQKREMCLLGQYRRAKCSYWVMRFTLVLYFCFQILKDFPEEMKGELGLHLHKEMLNLPIFEDATPGCLKSIALHTRRSFCAPGEFLVHKGDAANYLYLLSSGSMEILKTDLVVAILGMCAIVNAKASTISICFNLFSCLWLHEK